MIRTLLLSLALVMGAVGVSAKLPALSDEAKAKAAEAAAKTAHGNKVADFQLCKSREKVAERYRADAKKAGKEPGAQVDTPACADPGPFVYTPPAPASAPAATATAAPAAPAAASAAKKG
ncbi:hypothetical protein [Ideonella livida]|uniref:Uncharacterized protein n=1 Tax=Ideonella livida TaxID=2707176 RepID=A0A7C9PH69_9BURK|nr:hypothetical protein [Ideonella livida]NDY91833.1 hypothetical protein [Ideonella livida]